MKELFQGQFDYIYFFYGLSFFMLGVICFSIGKGRLRKIPWGWLGLFGIAHGLYEWLEMLLVIYGKTRPLAILSLFILATSFLFLFEFARIGLYRIKGRIIGRWVYLPILLLLFLVHKHGIDGWDIMIRYSLGFPGAYFAARIIYELYRIERKGNRSLAFLSAAMALYAVLVSLVVSKAAFFPANIINAESFYDTFGVPVQLIRSIIALCVAMAAWPHSASLSDFKYTPQAHFIRFVPTKRIIALTVIVLIVGGWIFTNYLDYYAGIRIIRNSEVRRNSSLNRLIRELTLLSKVTVSMSKIWVIKQAVSDKRQQDIETAIKTLTQYKDRYQALNSMLLDSEGMVIASAVDDEAEQVTKKSHSGRAYFKDALRGDSGYYFELGPRYNERKYYVSYPVRDKDENIVGVIVLTKNIQAVPIMHYRLLSIAITFFVFWLVVIFFLALRRREAMLDLVEQAHADLLTVDKMKSDFISIVSHELRTPLTSIRNAASILLKGGPAKRPIDSGEKELLDIVVANVDRQSKMVNDLLDISKIEENLIPINFEITDIVALMQEAVKSLQPQAEGKKIKMFFSSGIKKKLVSIDPEHTRRIADNLIVNAIKFTPKGGKITVSVEDADTEAKITVSDTGIGISAADQEKLFSKFFSSSDAKAKEQKGWGLGLAIAKSLVEAQGGNIGVDSEPEKGSVFYFTVQAVRKNDDKKKDSDC